MINDLAPSLLCYYPPRHTRQDRIVPVLVPIATTAPRAALMLLIALLVGCGGGGSSAGGPSGSLSTAGPSSTPTPTPTPPTGTTGTLSVVNGIIARSQTAGATLDVFASADPSGMIFGGWTGSTATLQTAGERRSGANPAAGAATVTATYKPLAEFTPQSAVINNRPVGDPSAVNAYWYFPQALPRGVIFRFHGTGGSGSTQFTKTEERKFARDAVGDGFAVVALDSTDRVNKSWDATTNPSNPAANVDVVNIQSVIASLSAQGLMNAGTAVYASGMSDGAGAALRFAFLLKWKASHQACVPGQLAIAQATMVPGIWTMAQNDTREDPNRNASALTNSQALSQNGVATQYIVVAPSAVYPSRFAQISGLSVADSQTIYSAIKAAGLLDSNDYQIKDPNDVNFASIIPAQYAASGNEITNQLNVAYTAHQFSAATDRRVLNFFEAHP